MSPPAPPQRPDLAPEQQHVLLAASAELLCASVLGRSATYADANLAAGAAQRLVSGAYVRLKRGGNLRGASGRVPDMPVPLGPAVADAVVRAAMDDARFPAVSPTELEHLEMEIWLLFNRQRLPLRGAERLIAVDPSKHGLTVLRMGQRGLLLPGDAVENGWDSQKFLEQVCLSAGLWSRMWKDGATSFSTFEGICLKCRVADFEAARAAPPAPPFLSPQELARCASAVLQNIRAFMMGAVPRYSLEGVPDGSVHGLFLALRWHGRPEIINLPTPISLRAGMPFQATLFQLAQTAVQMLAGHPLAGDQTAMMGISLVVLTDPAFHGAVASPSLEGFDSGKRLLVVMERDKFSAIYNPGQSAEEILSAAARQAQVDTPATAPVYSLSAASTEPSFKVASVPPPAQP